jgi:hypothetical protein
LAPKTSRQIEPGRPTSLIVAAVVPVTLHGLAEQYEFVMSGSVLSALVPLLRQSHSKSPYLDGGGMATGEKEN